MILHKSTLSKPPNLITSINLVFLDMSVVYALFSIFVNGNLIQIAWNVTLTQDTELLQAWIMQFLHYLTSFYLISPVVLRLGYVYGFSTIMDAISDNALRFVFRFTTTLLSLILCSVAKMIDLHPWYWQQLYVDTQHRPQNDSLILVNAATFVILTIGIVSFLLIYLEKRKLELERKGTAFKGFFVAIFTTIYFLSYTLMYFSSPAITLRHRLIIGTANLPFLQVGFPLAYILGHDRHNRYVKQHFINPIVTRIREAFTLNRIHVA